MQNDKAKWERIKMSPDYRPYTMWVAKFEAKTAKIHKTNCGPLIQIFENEQEIFAQMGGTISEAKKQAQIILQD